MLSCRLRNPSAALIITLDTHFQTGYELHLKFMEGWFAIDQVVKVNLPITSLSDEAVFYK